MGILDFVKGQLIDVIEYVDESNKILVYKYSRPGNEIKQGAKVIVRDSQVAVFLKGGQIADTLYAGTHVLNTNNMPILSTLAAFSYGFNSPVKADLYYISLKQFIDNKWATKNPIMMRDKEFNMVRVRSFGKYAFRITDAQQFMKEVFGTLGKVLTYDIIEYIASIITESVAITITNANLSVLDIAVKYRDMAEEVMIEANKKINKLGMAVTEIIIENLSLPEEVEKLIDEQSGIGMARKDMNTFMQYQTARAMRDASKQKGGLAGLGAGMAMGNTMAKTINEVCDKSNSHDIKSVADQLRELKSLVEEGILTQEEFDIKKKQLLGL